MHGYKKTADQCDRKNAEVKAGVQEDKMLEKKIGTERKDWKHFEEINSLG